MNEVFATYNQLRDEQKKYPRGARSGKPWTNEESALLLAYFAQRMSLRDMAVHCERSPSALVARLGLAGVLSMNPTGDYVVTHQGQTLINKDNDMNDNCKATTPYADDTVSDAPLIETVVLIHGKRADKMNDDQIFSMIANLEAAVEALDKVKNKPKKLQDRIAAVNEDIAKLVAYVDGR